MKSFFIILLSLLSISANALSGGGVGVGNGKKTFQAPQGFAVRYPEELDLKVDSKAKFEISNASMAKGEKVSTVSFTTTTNGPASLDALSAFLASSYPGKVFQSISLPGASGYFSEDRSTDHLSGIYFLLTSNQLLVQVNVDAYENANGLALVAPIVHTFSYDITPPVIQEMKVEKSEWQAGTAQKVYFHITDDNSGIALDRESIIFGSAAYSFTADTVLVAEGENWYSMEVKLSEYLPAGDYTIYSVSIRDNAGNLGGFFSLKIGDNLQNAGPALPPLSVHINNVGQSDTTPPVITALRVDNPIWQAGATQRVYFQATDDVSGIDLTHSFVNGFQSGDYEHNNMLFLPTRGPIKAAGNNWYYSDVEVGKYTRPGDFYLYGISLNDRAGNSFFITINTTNTGYDLEPYTPTPLPALKVQVVNSGEADTTPPVVKSLRVDSNVWPTGSTQKLYFEATDDLSGVYISEADARPALHGAFNCTDNKLNQTIFVDGKIQHELGDWYSIEVKVNPYFASGDYELQFLDIQDNAGNYNSLGMSTVYPGFYDLGHESDSPNSQIPILHVLVVR